MIVSLGIWGKSLRESFSIPQTGKKKIISFFLFNPYLCSIFFKRGIAYKKRILATFAMETRIISRNVLKWKSL